MGIAVIDFVISIAIVIYFWRNAYEKKKSRKTIFWLVMAATAVGINFADMIILILKSI